MSGLDAFNMYSKLNRIDYKYFQGSIDYWFCLYSCSSVFPFGFLTNKDFSSTLSYSRIVSENISSKSSSIHLTPSISPVSPSPEQNVDPENAVNSTYFDSDEIQTIKLLDKKFYFSSI